MIIPNAGVSPAPEQNIPLDFVLLLLPLLRASVNFHRKVTSRASLFHRPRSSFHFSEKHTAVFYGSEWSMEYSRCPKLNVPQVQKSFFAKFYMFTVTEMEA